MPEICRFYGIIIAMFYDEHNPPHFHARYGEYKMSVDILALSVLEGKFHGLLVWLLSGPVCTKTSYLRIGI